MKTKAGFLLVVGLGVVSSVVLPLLAKAQTDSVERLGSGKISIETKQKGNSLILNLESDLQDVVGLSVSTPGEAEDLLQIHAHGWNAGSTAAKAVVTSSAETLEGGFKTLVQYDLSQARELVVTIQLANGASYPLHFRGSVVNNKVEANLTSTRLRGVDAHVQ